MADTTKVFQLKRAPKVIQLFGDPSIAIESSTHIIEFPGGAVEISRTSDGDYWAHLIVNRDYVVDDCEGRVSAYGKVVDSRIDYEHPADPNIIAVPNAAQVRQVAVRIKPAMTA